MKHRRKPVNPVRLCLDDALSRLTGIGARCLRQKVTAVGDLMGRRARALASTAAAAAANPTLCMCAPRVFSLQRRGRAKVGKLGRYLFCNSRWGARIVTEPQVVIAFPLSELAMNGGCGFPVCGGHSA